MGGSGKTETKARRKITETVMSEVYKSLSVDDVVRISEIENVSFSEPWSKDSFRSLIENPDFITIGCYIDRVLAGYVFYYIVMNELHIMNIAVHPTYRKMSCGTKLLSEVHKEGMKRKLNFAYLEVRETNEAAMKLYAKLGYKNVGRRIRYYANEEDALLMFKELG